jgi:anti-sigma regulatory factor (Ser/Thr protein kinase)
MSKNRSSEVGAMADRLPLSLETLPNGFRFSFRDAGLASDGRQLFMAYLSSQVPAESDLFAVELVFGELVGNVARHAPGPVDVELTWEAEGARLEVWDTGSGYAAEIVLPDLLDESHRGMFLVAQYAEDLRVERRAGRTVTSAKVAINRARAGNSTIIGQKATDLRVEAT